MPGLLDEVRRLWALFEARRWSDAQSLLTPAAQCRWWATRERLDGAATIIQVNAIYPEGWSIHLLELNALPDGRVHSLVRVDQTGQSFYANSFFRIDPASGLIDAIDEYWSDVQPAPAWRTPDVLPGLRAMAIDERPGLDLG